MRKKPPSHENHERWMVSYADFLTLLFAVFVVLYSFAMSKKSEAQSMVQGIVQTFNEIGMISAAPGVLALPGPTAAAATQANLSAASAAKDQVNAPVQGGGGIMNFGMSPQTQDNNDATQDSAKTTTKGNLTETEVKKPTNGNELVSAKTEDKTASDMGNTPGSETDYVAKGGKGPTESSQNGESTKGMPFDTIKESISETIAQLGLESKITVEQTDNWLTINISSGLLFAKGSASVLNASRPILNEIAATLMNFKNYIRVRGYTDNAFTPNAIYANNWELSSARAVSVLNVLVDNGIAPARLAAEAYGQYSPFYSNSTQAGRAQNRRVVIAISRYSVGAPTLQVIPGDNEDLLPTPEAMGAGSGKLSITRGEDGKINLDLGAAKQ